MPHGFAATSRPDPVLIRAPPRRGRVHCPTAPEPHAAGHGCVLRGMLSKQLE